MSNVSSQLAATMPRWLVWVGSILIVFHFFALLCAATAVQSGPWPSMGNVGMGTPPQFAFTLNNITTPAYLQWIKMTHSYHFPTNRPGTPDAYFEVRLKDAKGEETETLKFPDPKANGWVRYRQSLLARALTDDQTFMSTTSEPIAAPGHKVPMAQIWSSVGQRKLELRWVPEHLLERNQVIFRPSDWNLVLVKSYQRHLCRLHGAASAELIRHTRDPIPPAVLFMDNFQPGAFDEVVSNYGELLK